MPNWCQNSLTINDLLPQQRDSIADALQEGEFLQTFAPLNDGEHGVDAWGTKWDTCDNDVYAEDDSINAYFSSAWSPPIQGLITISQQFPDATFRVRYDEGGVGFCGVSIIKNGEHEEYSTDYEDIEGYEELHGDSDDIYEQRENLVEEWLNQYD